MSDDLYPTPTRLALLRDIEAGQVRNEAGHAYDTRERRVTAWTLELTTAGWVELGGRTDTAGRPLYELTPAGCLVLGEHPEGAR